MNGRPAGRGQGLLGPPCPQREHAPQATPGGGPPHQRMCILCGRVTARSDVDLMPWCGGEFLDYPTRALMAGAA